MNTALPIMVVVGDKWSARCVITGGTISKAIFSVKISVADGYTVDYAGTEIAIIDSSVGDPVYTGANGITIGIGGNNSEMVINNVIDITDITLTSNTVVFVLPSELTKYFKPGKYSYNISVVEANTENTTAEQIITPVYTNAFNVYARVNAINPTNT